MAAERIDMHQMPLKDRLKTSVISYGIRQFAVIILTFGYNIVLTRYLMPNEYGMVAVITIVLNISILLADGGFGVYLIQRSAEVTEHDLARVTTIQLYAASLITIICALGAGTATLFSPGQRLGWMVAVASLSLPLLVIRGMALLRLERSVMLDRVVRVEVLEECVYALTAVAFAANGAGPWSVVIAQLTRAVTGCVSALYLGRFRFKRTAVAWDDDLRKGFKFGFHYQAAQLINMARVSVIPLFIIPLLGFQAGGFVERAWYFCGAPLSIILAIQKRALFPYVARIQFEIERIRRFAEDSIYLSSVLDKFMFLPLLIFAREIIMKVFGGQWLPMLPLIYWILAGNILFGALSGTLYPMANGIGKSELLSRFNFYNLLASWVLIVAGTLIFGIVGVGIASLVMWAGIHWLQSKIMSQIGKFRYYRQTLKPLFAFLITWGCMATLMQIIKIEDISLWGLASWIVFVMVLYGLIVIILDGKRLQNLFISFRETHKTPAAHTA